MTSTTRRTVRSLGRRVAATGVAAALLAGGLGLAAVAPAFAAPANNPADCSFQGYGSAADTRAVKTSSEEKAMVEMINAYRSSKGLSALRISTSLARPAMWMSYDSVKRPLQVVDHVDSRGMKPADRVAYCSDKPTYRSYSGEILYWGSGTKDGVAQGSREAALAWWQQSPGHNALLLAPDAKYLSVARAISASDPSLAYWTVDFGR